MHSCKLAVLRVFSSWDLGRRSHKNFLRLKGEFEGIYVRYDPSKCCPINQLFCTIKIMQSRCRNGPLLLAKSEGKRMQTSQLEKEKKKRHAVPGECGRSPCLLLINSRLYPVREFHVSLPQKFTRLFIKVLVSRYKMFQVTYGLTIFDNSILNVN